MQVEPTRLYRVKAVAESLDVSVATIYRAIEAGALRAVRVGTSAGAVRIPGQAITEYMAACERAAATHAGRRALAHDTVCQACGASPADRLVLPAEVVAAIVAAASGSPAAESAARRGER